MAKRSGWRYAGLRVISSVLRVVGWLTLMVSLIALIGALGTFSATSATPGQSGWLSGIGALGALGAVGFAFSSAISGIQMIAFGEIIRVLVDIAVNTGRLDEVSADTGFFRQRLDANMQKQS